MSTEDNEQDEREYEWHRILKPGELDEGRVMTVSVGAQTYAVSHYDGQFGCVDNACPHQGGPLGEGSIEKGWLRCPWHGFDYSPLTGQPPEGFSDAPACFTTEVREDGVYVSLPTPPPLPRTVSDVMIETMVNWGMTHVFGMVGHSNLGLADAMRKAEERGHLTFVGIRHEGAAAFAATAYGKLTGGVAGCFGIAGPGSTNLLTGLYDAKEDRAPVLALCGQVPSDVKGRGAFQDTDLEGAFADVAVFSETVHAASDHAELANLAMKTAIVERNVTHLVFPDEVQHMPVGDDVEPGGPDGRTGSMEISPPADELQKAIDMIAGAERPLIIVGNGTRGSMDNVMLLAEEIGAPVVTTFKGKGLVGDEHPLGCGVLGRSGTPIASWFMNESDLVIAFGASFSNHTGIAEYKPIIQVDTDPMSLGKFHSVDIPLLGHAAVTAAKMAESIPADRKCKDLRGEIAERWEIWRAEKARRLHDNAGDGMSAAAVMKSLTELVDKEAVITVDVGNNTYSFGRYFESSAGQDVLMSRYLGSIGFALPAAMGAWAAVGDSRQVVSISGDGGLGQYAMELTTLAKYDMNITHILMNNGELGKISKEQLAAEWSVWQTELLNPDFGQMAELCGVKGFTITKLEDLHDAIDQALKHDGPALVDIHTDALLI